MARSRSTPESNDDELARYRSLVEELPLNVFCKDLHGRVVFANRRCLQLMGMTLEEFLGKTDGDLFPPELAEKYLRDDRRVMTTGEPLEDVEEYSAPDGRRSYVQVFKAPIRNAAGDIVGVQGMFWDVSPRKRAEQALLESETRKGAILEAAFDAIVMAREDGTIVEFNHAAEEVFGHARDDVRGTPIERLFPEHSRNRIRVNLGKLFEDEAFQRFESPALRADGTTFVAEVSARTIPFDERPALAVFLRDVTEQRRAEAALEHERFLLHSLMEHVPDNVYFKDRDGTYLRINRAKALRSGLENPEDAVGKSDFDFFDREHAEKALDDEREVMRTGEPLAGEEERLVWPDGRVTWSSTTKVPLRDESGEIVGTFGISRDVTDRRRAREAIEEAKEAAEAANRAKSDFLANTSHEIRTPMNAIIGMTELLLDEPDLTGKQQEYLSIIRDSSESLLSVINSVLDFSKIEAGHVELAHDRFQVREVLGDAVKSLAVRAHRKDLELAYHVAPDVPAEIVGDAPRLRQVVLNLVGNAVKFTDEGEVVLHVACEARDEGNVVLLVSVRDTGIGIPADRLGKVFEAFEQADRTTTRRYEGTGLGLTISAQLVELMGGRLWAESEEGTGSTFRFTARFPIASHDGERPPRIATLSGLPVLVVDDNETNRAIVAEMVGNWEMRPRCVASVAEARSELTSAVFDDRPFAVVLCDVHMPDEDGFSLARHLRTVPAFERMPIVMLTSGERPEDAEACRRWRIDSYLRKPVKQSELFNAIIEAVDARPVAVEPAPTEPASDLPTRTLDVLLVEDSRPNQKLALGLLEKWGHRATLAENGREAVDLVRERDFDVVLMDVQMPEMDGHEATRAIRTLEQGTGRHTPIVAMTAHAMAEDRQKCLDAGMDSYVSKPIRPTILRNTIDAVVPHEPEESPAPAPETSPVPTSTAPSDDAPSNDEPIIDRAQSLAIAGGDSDLVGVVMEAFLEEFGELRDSLRGAVEAGDAEAVGRWGHRLKGSCRSIAATRLEHSLEALEQMGKTGDLTGANDRLATVEAMFPKLLAEIEELRSGREG